MRPANLFPTALGGALDYYHENDPFFLIPKNADALRDRSVIRIVCHIENENWRAPRCEALHELLMKHAVPHEFHHLSDVKSHNRGQVLNTMGDAGLMFFSTGFARLQQGSERSLRRQNCKV